MIDPEIDAVLRAIREDPGLPSFDGVSVHQARAREAAVREKYYRPASHPVAAIETVPVPGPAGDLPVRVYRPLGDRRPEATVVYFHGGGWVLGDLDAYDSHARRLAHTTGAVVVHVGYRNAPEHPFPAAYDDCVAATEWVWKHLDALGGSRRHLALAGDGAGGNLAAAVAVHCRDTGLPLAAHLLVHPPLDLYPALNGAPDGDRDCDPGGDPDCGPDGDRAGPVAPGEHWAWLHYLGGDPAQAADPRVSPLRTPTLAGLAPAVIGVGSHDALRPQCRAYAEALAASDVPVLYREYPGLVHAFFGMGTVAPRADRAAGELCRDLSAILQPDH
ncbi:alpha/beta hydrolase [Streptomyces sp. RS10V-4]|uniref:alpha/beta hydrolase n=1 Tax=Streptomyces rhizoryzae TaxID=2932493 RepID=UPI0020061344|nr:alpha/beta hydrolase [Streptomyces rhizoryzae]MCK7626627.1 alpha/beta hydrolase [Streptomyces rhizoryzae]